MITKVISGARAIESTSASGTIYTPGAPVIEYRGLSTDTKPTTGVHDGDCFIEKDTMKVYFYDEDSEAWVGGN